MGRTDVLRGRKAEKKFTDREGARRTGRREIAASDRPPVATARPRERDGQDGRDRRSTDEETGALSRATRTAPPGDQGQRRTGKVWLTDSPAIPTVTVIEPPAACAGTFDWVAVESESSTSCAGSAPPRE